MIISEDHILQDELDNLTRLTTHYSSYHNSSLKT